LFLKAAASHSPTFRAAELLCATLLPAFICPQGLLCAAREGFLPPPWTGYPQSE
jgi:hypothetical protein